LPGGDLPLKVDGHAIRASSERGDLSMNYRILPTHDWRVLEFGTPQMERGA
jgi:hypothetical protein